MDPYGLMNPGKLRLDEPAGPADAGGAAPAQAGPELPSAGWRYDRAGADSQPSDAR